MAKRRRRKMTAKQLKYFGPRRKRSRSRSRSTLPAVVSNPRRRRRHANPRAFRRRRRSNPRGLGGMMGQVTSTLMPAAIGAAGVLAVDRVIGFLPLENLSSEPRTQKHINRAARLIAVAGVGIAARNFLGNEQGSKIAVSAMGIAIHGLLASFFGSGAGLSGDMDGDDDMAGEMDGDDNMDGDDDGVGIYTNAQPLLEGEMDGDDDSIGDYMMEGDDDLGAYMGADDPIGAYMSGED